MWKIVTFSVFCFMVTSYAMDDMDMDAPECSSRLRHFTHAMIPAHVRVYIKNMMEKEMMSCLQIKCPEVGKEIMKDCLMESGFFTIIKEMIETETFPDQKDVGKFLEKLYRCKFDAMGVSFNETHLNMKDFRRLFNMDEWEGPTADKATAKEIMENCYETSYEGRTFVEKAMSLEKCFMLDTIDFCENEGRSTGLFFSLLAGLTTIGDDSICKSVRVDPKYKAFGKECFDEKVKNIGELPDDIKNTQNKMEKAKKLMKRFVDKIIYPVAECMGEKLGVYDPSTKEFDAEAGIKMVSSFPGWDSNETKEKITGQIRKCSKEFSNSYGELNTTDTMKQLWSEKMKYERCFWPMYVKTCGLSDTPITRFFAPLTDKDCRKALHEAFVTTTGAYMDVNLKALIQEKMASLMTVMM